MFEFTPIYEHARTHECTHARAHARTHTPRLPPWFQEETELERSADSEHTVDSVDAEQPLAGLFFEAVEALLDVGLLRGSYSLPSRVRGEHLLCVEGVGWEVSWRARVCQRRLWVGLRMWRPGSCPCPLLFCSGMQWHAVGALLRDWGACRCPEVVCGGRVFFGVRGGAPDASDLPGFTPLTAAEDALGSLAAAAGAGNRQAALELACLYLWGQRSLAAGFDYGAGPHPLASVGDAVATLQHVAAAGESGDVRTASRAREVLAVLYLAGLSGAQAAFGSVDAAVRAVGPTPSSSTGQEFDHRQAVASAVALHQLCGRDGAGAPVGVPPNATRWSCARCENAYAQVARFSSLQVG